jgi:hypothetical protein
MSEMLVENECADLRQLYDHRYFYVEEGRGHCFCGLARDCMAEIIRSQRKEALFLETPG